MDGLSLLSHARSVDNDLAVILITGHGDIAMAVNAMRQGAYDFVEKPFPPQRLIDVAARAAEKRRLVLQVRALRRQLADQQGIEFVLGNYIELMKLREQFIRTINAAASGRFDRETLHSPDRSAARLSGLRVRYPCLLGGVPRGR